MMGEIDKTYTAANVFHFTVNMKNRVTPLRIFKK